MKLIKLGLILGVCSIIFGCASPAKMENMVYQGNPKTYTKELQKNVNVASVSGGKKTNPAWTSEINNDAFLGALKQSLLTQGLLADNGRYRLEVNLLSIDQPMFGFDMTVTTYVKYTLTDVKRNAVVMSETITAVHTATVGDAFAGVKRLRMANEGSGKKNIENFLDKLSGLKIKPNEVSLAQ
ncbi:MAG TPA: hypothetical protein VF268_08820 [Gammaproteobacteria bacterium]